jgi:hypothetical protein
MPKKTNEDIAYEVYQGGWGNGEDRKNRLTNAGYDYGSVQDIVNQIAAGTYQSGGASKENTASTNTASTNGTASTGGATNNYNFSYYDTPSYISPYADQISQVQGQIGNYGNYNSQYGSQIDNLLGQVGNYGPYQSQYADQISQLLNQYNNRGEFSYDYANDPLYQMYEKAYTANGQQAMKDTLGQLAGINGGYASSYAQKAGQQAYDNYMTQLSAMVPELENRAYGRWQDAGAELLNRLGLYQNMDATEYGRWQDAFSNLYNQLSAYQNQDSTEYGRWRDSYNDLYDLLGMYLDQDTLAYNRWRDAYGDYLDTYARGLAGSGGSGRGGGSGKGNGSGDTKQFTDHQLPPHGSGASPLDYLYALAEASRNNSWQQDAGLPTYKLIAPNPRLR